MPKPTGTACAHGTWGRYWYGCRCVACKRANADRSAKGRVLRVRTDPHRPSQGTYSHGCRCDGCKAAHRQYIADLRKRRQGTLTADDPRHGTRNGWDHFGCRCDRCAEAHRRANYVYYWRAEP